MFYGDSIMGQTGSNLALHLALERLDIEFVHNARYSCLQTDTPLTEHLMQNAVTIRPVTGIISIPLIVRLPEE